MEWGNAEYMLCTKGAAIYIALVIASVILFDTIGIVSHLHPEISPEVWVNFEEPLTETKVAWLGWIRARKLVNFIDIYIELQWLNDFSLPLEGDSFKSTVISHMESAYSLLWTVPYRATDEF